VFGSTGTGNGSTYGVRSILDSNREKEKNRMSTPNLDTPHMRIQHQRKLSFDGNLLQVLAGSLNLNIQSQRIDSQSLASSFHSQENNSRIARIDMRLLNHTSESFLLRTNAAVSSYCV